MRLDSVDFYQALANIANIQLDQGVNSFKVAGMPFDQGVAAETVELIMGIGQRPYYIKESPAAP